MAVRKGARVAQVAANLVAVAVASAMATATWEMVAAMCAEPVVVAGAMPAGEVEL